MCQSPHFHLSCSSPYLYLVVLCLECHFQSFFVGKSTHNSLINSVVRWRVNLRIWANNAADKNVVPMTNASGSHIFFLLRKTNILNNIIIITDNNYIIIYLYLYILTFWLRYFLLGIHPFIYSYYVSIEKWRIGRMTVIIFPASCCYYLWIQNVCFITLSIA